MDCSVAGTTTLDREWSFGWQYERGTNGTIPWLQHLCL